MRIRVRVRVRTSTFSDEIGSNNLDVIFLSAANMILRSSIEGEGEEEERGEAQFFAK